jgi:hypothetical protein
MFGNIGLIHVKKNRTQKSPASFKGSMTVVLSEPMSISMNMNMHVNMNISMIMIMNMVMDMDRGTDLYTERDMNTYRPGTQTLKQRWTPQKFKQMGLLPHGNLFREV